MALWLHAATHHSKGFPWFAIFHDEARNDGVKRPFSWRVDVGVARLHREEFTAILKHEAEPGNHDAATHPAIIALDERNHVALIIGRAHINSIAPRGRIPRRDGLGSMIRVDQFATFGRVGLG